MIYSKVSIGDKIKCVDDDMETCVKGNIYTVDEVHKDGWLTVKADTGVYSDKLVDVPPDSFILL